MELNMFLNYIGNCIKHMNEDIERLHSNQYNNSVVLDHLSSEVFMLEVISNILASQIKRIWKKHSIHIRTSMQIKLRRKFQDTLPWKSYPDTMEKNGAPAYVAVNGVVYDVTNNSVWKGDSHFGLNPGNDLSVNFATCHPGALVLTRLPIIGYLATE